MKTNTMRNLFAILAVTFLMFPLLLTDMFLIGNMTSSSPTEVVGDSGLNTVGSPQVAKAAFWLLVCVSLAAAALLVLQILYRRRMKDERDKRTGTDLEEPEKKRGRGMVCTVFILVISCACAILGYFNDSVYSIYGFWSQIHHTYYGHPLYMVIIIFLSIPVFILSVAAIRRFRRPD